MKVQIKKGPHIFELNSMYNQKVLRIIKTIKNRYYCRKKRHGIYLLKILIYS